MDGEVRNGTAAGWRGDENTGGPGGVLIRGTGLPVRNPFAGEGKLGVFIDGDGIWLDKTTGGGGYLVGGEKDGTTVSVLGLTA